MLRGNASVFDDIPSLKISKGVESTLRELEMNATVARQFIRLADGCLGIWRTQGRGTNPPGDIGNTATAGELESRVQELEVNIAAARQFIKKAAECLNSRSEAKPEETSEARINNSDAPAIPVLPRGRNLHKAAYDPTDVQ